MVHLYQCEILNTEKPEVKFEQVFTGNITEQITILKRFEKLLEERKRILENDDTTPCDPNVIHCSRQSIVMD